MAIGNRLYMLLCASPRKKEENKSVKISLPVIAEEGCEEEVPVSVVHYIVYAWQQYDWKRSSDALTDWLNARWSKTPYRVSKQEVFRTLRACGFDAEMGLGDHLDGAYTRE